MSPRFVPLAALHVAGQPQPPFCYLQENQLGVRVVNVDSHLGAGFGIRSVHIAAVHEGPNLPSLTIARHLNAAPHLLVPDFLMELAFNLWNGGLTASFSKSGSDYPLKQWWHP
jgi:hypothetical protein